MDPKFKVGDLVRTIQGSAFDIEGIVTAIMEVTPNVSLLWADDIDPRYEIRDTVTGEYVYVIERGLEKYQINKRRHRKIPNRWQ